MSIIEFGKALYRQNRTLFMVLLIFVVAVFVVGCTQSGGVPPPSGPVGGGCGG